MENKELYNSLSKFNTIFLLFLYAGSGFMTLFDMYDILFQELFWKIKIATKYEMENKELYISLSIFNTKCLVFFFFFDEQKLMFLYQMKYMFNPTRSLPRCHRTERHRHQLLVVQPRVFVAMELP